MFVNHRDTPISGVGGCSVRAGEKTLFVSVIRPGTRHYACAIAGANFVFLGVDQRIKCGAVNQAFFDEKGFEGLDAQGRIGRNHLVIMGMIVSVIMLLGAGEIWGNGSSSSGHCGGQEVAASRSPLDRILADDYRFTRDDGTLMTKRRTLDGFRPGGGRQVLSYKLMDEKVRVKGDLAVITYRCRVSEIFEGREDSGDFSLTRILARHETFGEWSGAKKREFPICRWLRRAAW